jgi:hypothetical protein
MNERFDEVNRRLASVETQLVQLNKHVINLSVSFADQTKSLAMSNRALIVAMALGFLTILATKL